VNTSKTFEDGRQATVDDLKELNLRTAEEQSPYLCKFIADIWGRKEYFDLLSEYKDMFASSYKEIQGYIPSLLSAAYLSEKGVSPKKVAPMAFPSRVSA